MASSPGVYLTFPTIYKPIPDSLPHAIPPPVKERSFRAPFGINKTLYNFALRPEIPLTFAAAYVISVFALNAYNRRRKHAPWWISKQPWFKNFIVVHNVLLSLYSFATFIAMFRAIVHTMPSLDADNWGPKAADALCKLHGPRGLGDAATFNTTINIWEVKNAVIKLGYDGNPDPTDIGRLWNEGLAFWGWLFYVSKFYEVLDTVIILAKGKRSATLQTYHHAGAMLCMWAGIRYMSPPIWMFVFINSAIHAMMYTYFSLSALGYKVPQGLKRALTSLQIAQFVFGASYAAAHLFVAYDIPVQTPFRVTSVIERAASSASSAARAATKSATSAASVASAAPTLGALIKKLLLRAAGEEGMAERVGMDQQIRDAVGNPVGMARQALPKAEDKVEKWLETRYETHYRSDWTKVSCIDTSGEAFAIYLNLLYLAPLTFLFARFFVRAYTQRGKRNSFSQKARKASEAAKDASNQTEYEVEKSGKKMEDEVQQRGSQALDESSERLEELRKDVKAMKEGTFRDRRVSDRVQSFEEKAKTAAEKTKELVNGKSGSSRKSSPSKKAAPEENEGAVEDDPASKKGEGGASSNESEKQQDVKPADSQATRPGDEPASKGSDGDGAAGSESAKQQDENLDGSQATRPGTEDPADEKDNAGASADSGNADSGNAESGNVDSDAMGQSGSIVDFASEKAQESSEKASDEPRWKPIGANGT